MISIIVPLFNHLTDLTQTFIKSIQECEGNWELVLVDNGSADGTWEYISKIAKKDKRIKPIKSKINLGFGGGNNLGYLHSKGEEVCFISNDVVINDKDFLLKLSSALAVHKGKALLGPQYIDYNQLTSYKLRPTPYIGGWCMYGNRELFQKVTALNGFFEDRPQIFDEGFGQAYFEDVWLSKQAMNLGYKLKEVGLDLQHLISKSSDKMDISGQVKIAQTHFLNKMMYSDLNKRKVKRIVFYCPGVPYGFIDEDYEGKGVGGAEASLILLSRELAKLGYQVEIYNRTAKTGKFGGVYYNHLSEFRHTDYCDYFILYRAFHSAVKVTNTVFKIFWSCDQFTDPAGIWNSQIFPYVDKAIAISPFHKKYLDKHYRTRKKVKVIDLGIKWDDYKKPVKKIPGKAIFCSVPMRGLERLIKMASEIKKQVPNFKLVITSDYRLWGCLEPRNKEFVEMAKGKDYIKFLGKVERKELVKHQKESELMVYPCNYDECFCISAMECMAAGAVPVVIKKGALSTTISEGGKLLSNSITDKTFIKSVVELFKNRNKRLSFEKKGRKIAKAHAWTQKVQEWVRLFKEMEEKMANTAKIECPECGQKMLNTYVLKRHLAAKHGVKAVDLKGEKTEKIPVEMPKITVLKFKQGVEFMINGVKYAGSEIEIPVEMVSAAVDIVTTAYGDILV